MSGNANDSYGDANYVNANFNAKLCSTSGPEGFVSDLKALWGYFRDKPTAAHVGMIVFALAYFISPVDAVPDPIPVAGFLDDAAVVAGAVASIGSVLNRYR